MIEAALKRELQVQACKIRMGVLDGVYAGLVKLYFFVPEGTRSFGVAEVPLLMKIFNPEGKVAAVPPAKGSAEVEVPEGMDGRIWSAEANWGYFPTRFIGVPEIYAAKPEHLLVPRELLEK